MVEILSEFRLYVIKIRIVVWNNDYERHSKNKQRMKRYFAAKNSDYFVVKICKEVGKLKNFSIFALHIFFFV